MSTPTKVLFSERQIQERVDEIVSKVNLDFVTRQLAVVGLLEDSFVFMADLIRKLDMEVVCYFMKAEVDEHEGLQPRIKRIFYSPELDIQGKDVVLIGGVLDTGVTLDYITKQILHGRPERVKICYLIDKPNCRKISVKADYAGFVLDKEVPEYIVGYGLGYDNKFRNLPYLGILDA